MLTTHALSLIMILIQSDAFKAIWFMIYPIVVLASGPVTSESAFCQASGFFLALGFEACDMAVIIVAVHIALYIFRGAHGLYDFRYYAYSAWVFIPLLLACLAFINNPAYVDTGEYCYLPSVPAWPRRALDWIPRYVIFVSLIVIYAVIYIYVTVLMSRFSSLTRMRRDSKSPVPSTSSRRQTPTSGDTIQPTYSHELASSAPPSLTESRDLCGRRVSESTLNTDSHLLPGPGPSPRLPACVKTQDHAIPWNTTSFGSDAVSPPVLPRIDSEGFITSPSTAFPAERRRSLAPPLTTNHSMISPCSGSPAISPSTARSFWKRSAGPRPELPSRDHSVANPFSSFSRSRRGSGSTSSIFLSQSVMESTGMLTTREKMRRQLRKLFIYPLAYLAIWLVPFIAHNLYGPNSVPSFPVVILRAISLCISGTVNALIFCIKEEPWRHHDKTWQMRRDQGRQSRTWTNPNVGRSREEMLIDGRLARKRREVEIAERTQLKLQQTKGFNTVKEWWDGFFTHTDGADYDGSELHEREDV